VYVVVNVGSVHYRVCVLEIGVCVVVNVGSVHYRVCVLEIGVCGCKCRSVHYRACVLEIIWDSERNKQKIWQ